MGIIHYGGPRQNEGYRNPTSYISFEPEFHADHFLQKDYGSKINPKRVICKNMMASSRHPDWLKREIKYSLSCYIPFEPKFHADRFLQKDLGLKSTENKLFAKLSKAESYLLYKGDIRLENYLFKIKNIKHRKALTRLRLSCHPLMIEKGRHRKPPLK